MQNPYMLNRNNPPPKQPNGVKNAYVVNNSQPKGVIPRPVPMPPQMQKNNHIPHSQSQPIDLRHMKVRMNSLFEKTQGIIQKQKIQDNVHPPNFRKSQQYQPDQRHQQRASFPPRPSSNHQEFQIQISIPKQTHHLDRNPEKTFPSRKEPNIHIKPHQQVQTSTSLQMKRDKPQPSLFFQPKSEKNGLNQQHENSGKENQIVEKNGGSQPSSPKKITASREKSVEVVAEVNPKEKENFQLPKELKKEMKSSKQQNEISWTRFVSLQLKYESLERELKEEKVKSENNTQDFKKIIEQKEKTIKLIATKLSEERAKWEEERKNMKKLYEEQLTQKNQHIQELVQEVTGLSFGQKQEIFKKKILDVVNNNNMLQEQLIEKQEHFLAQENLIKEKQESINELQVQISLKNKQITDLSRQIETLREAFQTKQGFDQFIRIQLANIQKYKEKVELLEDENYRLRTEINNQQKEISNIKNEQKMNEIKSTAFQNRIATELGFQIHEQSNSINTLEKKYLTLQDKYRLAQREVKEKDDFIQQYLVGRTDNADVKDHVREVLSKFEQKFSKNDEQALQEQINNLTYKLSLYERNWKTLSS